MSTKQNEKSDLTDEIKASSNTPWFKLKFDKPTSTYTKTVVIIFRFDFKVFF